MPGPREFFGGIARCRFGPSPDSPVGSCFMPSPDEKVVKNRPHLDLTCAAEDRGREKRDLVS